MLQLWQNKAFFYTSLVIKLPKRNQRQTRLYRDWQINRKRYNNCFPEGLPNIGLESLASNFALYKR